LTAIDSVLRSSRDRAMGQHVSLHGGRADEDRVSAGETARLTMEQKLAGEKELLGIYVPATRWTASRENLRLGHAFHR